MTDDEQSLHDDGLARINAAFLSMKSDRDQLLAQSAGLKARVEEAEAHAATVGDEARGMIRGLLAELQEQSSFKFGLAHGANEDVTAIERRAGVTMGIHRTYWHLGKIRQAITQAKFDIAAGRTPWLSFKFTATSSTKPTWSDAAAGKFDHQIVELRKELQALGEEVWVTFHHEPEAVRNLETMSNYVPAQRRALELVAATNVVRAVVLMGWHQVVSKDSKLSVEALWPGDDYAEVLAFDPYCNFATIRHPSTDDAAFIKHFDHLELYFSYLADWAKARGKAWAIAEAGITTKAVETGRPGTAHWIIDTALRARRAGARAFVYFHSNENAETLGDLRTEKSAIKAADLDRALQL